MAKALSALDYLARVSKYPALPVCCLYGDEPFLKRQVLEALRHNVLSSEADDDEGDFSLTTFEGKVAELPDVLDALATLALFGAKRLVIVEGADDFVSANRAALEDYVEKSKPSGVLVLEVTKWPSNTRLYKRLAKSGLQIECKFPTDARLLKWITSWSKQKYDATLEPGAAERLLELVEPEMGLLDQELAKLAMATGRGGSITAQTIEELVGTWRTKTAWVMLDAAADGNSPEALAQLERLLQAAQHPVALLAQISSTLRRFAAATSLIDQAERAGRKLSLNQALEQAGFKPFVMQKAQSQIRQLGRQRAGNLYRWLLQADLAIKGPSSSPPRARLVLEQLIVRMSSACGAGKAASGAR